MAMKVKEVADLVGISVRTLHHYDEIGLLTPDEVTSARISTIFRYQSGKAAADLIFQGTRFLSEGYQRNYKQPLLQSRGSTKYASPYSAGQTTAIGSNDFNH